MTRYENIQDQLRANPKTWLLTGVAGFIGSNLLETLLILDQPVVGIDNFATGKRENLEEVRGLVSAEQWTRFRFFELDIAESTPSLVHCFENVDYVLHQAALGSVPRSIANPEATHRSNVTGFLNVLNAAKKAKVKRFVYASSSSVYGDDPNLPKVEERTGNVLSPYAATKVMNELYAGVFCRVYGMSAVGLRYFNVFGPRQDPLGQYAAVIPQWVLAMVEGKPAYINGDGSTSRDFCFVGNVVQANLLSATAVLDAPHAVFNVALNARTTLLELFELIRTGLQRNRPELACIRPEFRPNRPGDIQHSQANVTKACAMLGYVPAVKVDEGISIALNWYERRLGHSK